MSNPQAFLRRILALDAVSSGGMAVLLLLGAEFLEPWLGLPAGLQRGAGAVLIPFAAFAGWLAMRARPPRAAVYAVTAMNGLWTAETLLTAAAGWFPAATPFGIFFIAAQAFFVAVLGGLQLLGLRRAQPAMA